MRLLLTLAILLLATVASGHGNDYEEAYRLRERQEILPLEELLRRRDLGADTRILEIESELEHGRHVYEIEYLDSNVIEVFVRRLREKLGKDAIETRRGQGYVFHD